MENETLKLTSVLADPTRFTIYQRIANMNRPVNVQEIADDFSIHPNVARLHLSKLEDVNLLKSVTEKTGKGGRPSRLYALSDEVVSLQFPPRDYQLLAKIAIETLISLGEEGIKALQQMGKRFGMEAAKQALHQEGIAALSELTTQKKLEILERLIVAQGLQPKLEVVDENTLNFQVNNCVFESPVKISNDQSICLMHQHLLMGIFETILGDIDLIPDNHTCGTKGTACQYIMVRLPIS